MSVFSKVATADVRLGPRLRHSILSAVAGLAVLRTYFPLK